MAKTKSSVIKDEVLQPYYIRVETDQYSVHKEGVEGSSYIPPAEGYYPNLELALNKIADLKARNNLPEVLALESYVNQLTQSKAEVLASIDSHIQVGVVREEHAHTPQYKSSGASGFDFQSLEECILHPHDKKLFKTGLRMSIPRGYELQIRSRSGLALNDGIIVLNSPGTIDSDYRGEIGIVLYNSSANDHVSITPGDRIAQGVIVPVVRAKLIPLTELDVTERGIGGFGSTGV